MEPCIAAAPEGSAPQQSARCSDSPSFQGTGSPRLATSLEVRLAASFTLTPLWSSDLAPCSAGQVLEVVAEPTAPKLDYKALLGGVPSEITQVDKQAQKKEAARLKVEREQAQQQVGPHLCPCKIISGHGVRTEAFQLGSFFCVPESMVGMALATAALQAGPPAAFLSVCLA